MAAFTGSGLEKLFAAVDDLEQEAVQRCTLAARAAIVAMMDITPVWSGETVRNYTAAWKRPDTTYAAPAGEPPIGKQGRDTPLGAEENRAANELAALARVEANLSNANRLEDLFITNTVDPALWALIDSGSAPDKERARSPGGQSAIGAQTLEAYVNRK